MASEVRNLASRTKEATAEISNKIAALQLESAKTAMSMEESSINVSKTTEGISNLGQSLDQILEAFQTVNDEVSHIAAGIAAQSSTTREVTTGIESASGLSSEVGKMAGEVAHEVKNLRGIADELLVALGTLRLEAHEKTQGIVEEISNSKEIVSLNRSRQEAFLGEMARRYPFIELLYITDERGIQVTSNISTSSGLTTSYGNDGCQMDWSSRPWFIAAKDSKRSHVTDFYLSVATNTFCYTVSSALRDEENRIKGVLGADINFQTFYQLEKAGTLSIPRAQLKAAGSAKVGDTARNRAQSLPDAHSGPLRTRRPSAAKA